jgi:biotin carboxylase
VTVSAVQRPFTRLAIANRGEAAMRTIHALRELNDEAVERGLRRTLEHVAAGHDRTR